MKKQNGYLSIDYGKFILTFGIVIALVAAPLGWLGIEALLWALDHISIVVK